MSQFEPRAQIADEDLVGNREDMNIRIWYEGGGEMVTHHMIELLVIDKLAPRAHIMRATGLRDRDGRVIYEGDVLAAVDVGPHDHFEVVWVEYVAQFRIRRMSQDHPDLPDFIGIAAALDVYDLQVVGNIYEGLHNG